MNYYLNQTQNLLNLLNETERDRCWEILSFVIAGDFKKLPGYLTDNEEKALKGLQEIHKKNELKDHSRVQINQSAAVRDADKIHEHSRLEMNLFLRQDILHYAIKRTDKKLQQEESPLKEPARIKLQNERHMFNACWKNLEHARNDYKEFRKTTFRGKVAWKSIIASGAVASAAIGLCLVATMIPPLGLSLIPLGLLYGAGAGLVGGYLIKAITKPFHTILMKRSTRKLGKQVSEKLSKFSQKLNDNPGQVEDKALQLATLQATRKFGFFGNRHWNHNANKVEIPEIPHIQLPAPTG